MNTQALNLNSLSPKLFKAFHMQTRQGIVSSVIVFYKVCIGFY